MSFLSRLKSVGNFFLGQSVSSGVFGWALPGQWSKTQLLEQYVTSGIVYATVSAIAEEAAKIQFKVVKKDANGEDVEVKQHAFVELMKKPNPKQSQFQFLELHFTYMDLAGECFWYLVKGTKTGSTKEIYILRPDMVEVVIAAKDNPRGLVTEYKFTNNSKVEKFKPEEILHFKMPNPVDPDSGLGPVQAGKNYVETERFATDWTKNSLYNSGRPSGVVTLKGAIGDEAFQKFKKQFTDKYTGTKNAGKLAFFKGSDGVEFEKLGMDLSEVALKELKDMARDDVMVAWRMSKTMIGISDDVNRANAQENHAVFIENVVEHKVDRLVDHLTAFFPHEEGEIITYQPISVTTQKDREDSVTTGNSTNTLTVNEKRKLMGQDPKDGFDFIPAPLNITPLLNEEDFKKKEEERAKLAADMADQKNNPGAPGDKKTPAKDDKKDDSKKGVKKKGIRPELVEYYRTLFFKNQESWEDKYAATMRHEFKLQEKEILDRNPVKGFKAYFKTKSVFPEWLFAVDVVKSRLIGSFTPLILELMKQAAKFSLEIAEDEDTELLITEAINQEVHNRIDQLATETSDVTIKLIEKEIAEGLTEGDSIQKLRARIQSVYRDANDTRATMIARTETINASNAGAIAAYKQSSQVIGKEWSAESNACAFCASLNGKVYGVEDSILRNGDVIEVGDQSFVADYGDVIHPPLHPNCRCALLPVRLQ